MRLLRDSKSPNVWYVEWRDHRGNRHRWAGFADRRSTEALGHRLETLARCVLIGCKPDSDTADWLAGLPFRTTQRLAALGLGGRAEADLVAQLVDYRRALEARELSPVHVSWTVATVEKMLTAIKASTLADVTPARVVAYLAQLREKRRSAATRNRHLKALKAYLNWLVREERSVANPIAHVAALNEETDRRHDRRALSEAEISALLATTASGPDRFGLSGSDRAMLYRLALETGLRLNELRSLRVCDAELGGDQPCLTVRAAFSKRRRMDRQPIPLVLARELAERVADRLPAAPLVALPRQYQVIKMLRADLAAAAVEYEDASGRFADFHALRHTYITRLSLVADSFATLQALARHSTPVLTARYSHPRLSSLRSAVESLTPLAAGHPEKRKPRRRSK